MAQEGARGIFVGLPRETILLIQKRAVDFMLEGKTLMTYGDGVTQGSRQFSMPPADALLECKYALERLDGRVRSLITNYNRQVDR
jgi:hypothetical protein